MHSSSRAGNVFNYVAACCDKVYCFRIFTDLRSGTSCRQGQQNFRNKFAWNRRFDQLRTYGAENGESHSEETFSECEEYTKSVPFVIRLVCLIEDTLRYGFSALRPPFCRFHRSVMLLEDLEDCERRLRKRSRKAFRPKAVEVFSSNPLGERALFGN